MQEEQKHNLKRLLDSDLQNAALAYNLAVSVGLGDWFFEQFCQNENVAEAKSFVLRSCQLYAVSKSPDAQFLRNFDIQKFDTDRRYLIEAWVVDVDYVGKMSKGISEIHALVGEFHEKGAQSRYQELYDLLKFPSGGIVSKVSAEEGEFIIPQKTNILNPQITMTVTDAKARRWNLHTDNIWRHTQKNGKVIEKPYYRKVSSRKGVHKFARWWPNDNMVFTMPSPDKMPKGILDWPNPLNEQM